MFRTSLLLSVALALASCGPRNASGTEPDAAQVKSQIQQRAASAPSDDARKALLAFADSGALAQQREFLAGRYALPIPDPTTEQMGSINCRPKGCHVRLICHANPKTDNPCETGDISVDCETPC